MAAMKQSTRKTTKRTPYIIGPADDAILRVIYRYHRLTIDQVTRLLYSRGTRNTVSTRLKNLADAGCLERIVIPSRSGKGPVVYTLARKGQRYLGELGFVIPRRGRSSEDRQASAMHLNHTLAVNDFLINAELFARAHAGTFILQQLLPERRMKQRAVKVDDGTGTLVTVAPDGYIDLVITDQYRFCFALELDMGTEDQRVWRNKVHQLLRYAAGPYQHAFGTDGLTICVVTTAGETRLEHLLQWTTVELTERGQQHEADLFRFSQFQPAQLSPNQMFLGAGWLVPFGTTTVALVDRALLAHQMTPLPTNGVATPARTI
jgi:Replication-relaxation